MFLKPQKGIKPTRSLNCNDVQSVKAAEHLPATMVSVLGTTGSRNRAIIWRGRKKERKKEKDQNSPRCVSDQYPEREGRSQTLPF